MITVVISIKAGQIQHIASDREDLKIIVIEKDSKIRGNDHREYSPDLILSKRGVKDFVNDELSLIAD